jgi:hypothetical protein
MEAARLSEMLISYLNLKDEVVYDVTGSTISAIQYRISMFYAFKAEAIFMRVTAWYIVLHQKLFLL